MEAARRIPQLPDQPAPVPTTPVDVPQVSPAQSPATAFNIPTAFGRGSGHAGIGMALQNRTRLGNATDGIAGMAFGVGDRRKAALEVGLNLSNLSPTHGQGGGLLSRGSFNLKLHHAASSDLAMAVGIQNTFVWGGSDAPTVTYGVLSKTFALKDKISDRFSRLYLSLGVKHYSVQSRNNNAISQSVIRQDGRNNVFGSAAIKVTPQFHLFTEWTGSEMDIGTSISLFRRFPLVLTPALADVTKRHGNRPRFDLGLGLPFQF